MLVHFARCAGSLRKGLDALLHYGASRLVIAGLGTRQSEIWGLNSILSFTFYKTLDTDSLRVSIEQTPNTPVTSRRMSLRRSARLGSIPTIKAPQQATVKVARVPTNGITKPRKASTVKKAAPSVSTEPQANKESSYWSPEPPIGPSTNSFDKQISDKITNSRPHTPPLDRPVDPHRTNATLLTPHGSSVTAYPSRAEDASPSKTGNAAPAGYNRDTT